MKYNNFRGDLSYISAKKEALVPTRNLQMHPPARFTLCDASVKVSQKKPVALLKLTFVG